MTRRTWLWILGLSAFALFIVLGTIDRTMSDTAGPGIVGFELAGSEDRAHEILADWGPDGHDAAVRRGWTRLASIGSTVIAFPIAAAIADALENVGLLLALGGHGGNAAPL